MMESPNIPIWVGNGSRTRYRKFVNSRYFTGGTWVHNFGLVKFDEPSKEWILTKLDTSLGMASIFKIKNMTKQIENALLNSSQISELEYYVAIEQLKKLNLELKIQYFKLMTTESGLKRLGFGTKRKQ